MWYLWYFMAFTLRLYKDLPSKPMVFVEFCFCQLRSAAFFPGSGELPTQPKQVISLVL